MRREMIQEHSEHERRKVLNTVAWEDGYEACVLTAQLSLGRDLLTFQLRAQDGLTFPARLGAERFNKTLAHVRSLEVRP